MNYLKIVLDGYCNENSRNHLVDYFKREAINAKENHYNFEEFFDGCNKEVENLQKYYHYYLNKNKNGFYNVNDAARNRQTTIQEGFFEAFGFTEYSSKSYEEQCDKLIEINNEHIKGLDLNNYWQPLISLNMGYNGHLLYNDTLQISEAILSAKKHFELQELKGIFQNIIQEAAIKVTQKAVQPQPESTLLITAVERSRMIEIYKYLSEKKYIDVDVDSWLYWFSKHTWTNQKKKPSTIKWIEAAYHLPNVVYLICGNMEVQTESAMKKAFKLPTGSKFQKLTTKNINGDFYNNIKNKLNWAERFAIK